MESTRQGRGKPIKANPLAQAKAQAKAEAKAEAQAMADGASNTRRSRRREDEATLEEAEPQDRDEPAAREPSDVGSLPVAGSSTAPECRHHPTSPSQHTDKDEKKAGSEQSGRAGISFSSAAVIVVLSVVLCGAAALASSFALPEE